MADSPFPTQLADRCVMCGLCIPHCPTYGLSQSENESPRGRISLMMGLARGQLEADSEFLQHLDHCLGCRACEGICPSDVPYGTLLNSQRQVLKQQGLSTLPWGTRLLMTLLASPPARLKHINNWLHRYQRWGAAKLVALLGYFGSAHLKRLHRYLPPVSKPNTLSLYPADTKVQVKGKVNLFRGCASRLFDQETSDAAIFLLRHLGYAVNIPDKQVCCGAMHRNEGDIEASQQLASANITAFGRSTDPIISTASGCTTHLKEYPQHNDALDAEPFSQQVVDISDFLSRVEWPKQYTFEAMDKKIAVHEPCLQRNVLKQGQSAYSMLSVIPNLNIQPLNGNQFCCGAAGTHMFSQPEQADALLNPKLEAIDKQDIDILVTTNIGCALHIQAGLKQRGRLIEVIHPATLLARQLRIKA
ncbi:MAG: (Fe-S)-binding protein [Gammaproteobacteria bacterium]|nr:(Fe-S)-binding protein [Gammaproteobacteria bacterium]